MKNLLLALGIGLTASFCNAQEPPLEPIPLPAPLAKEESADTPTDATEFVEPIDEDVVIPLDGPVFPDADQQMADEQPENQQVDYVEEVAPEATSDEPVIIEQVDAPAVTEAETEPPLEPIPRGRPVAPSPVTGDPVVRGPVIHDPVVRNPVVSGPVVNGPAVVRDPVVYESAPPYVPQSRPLPPLQPSQPRGGVVYREVPIQRAEIYHRQPQVVQPQRQVQPMVQRQYVERTYQTVPYANVRETQTNTTMTVYQVTPQRMTVGPMRPAGFTLEVMVPDRSFVPARAAAYRMGPVAPVMPVPYPLPGYMPGQPVRNAIRSMMW